MNFSLKCIKALNIMFLALLILMPYYLFDGRLFIGGDDSRLFYAFPDLWLKNMGWFSWFRLSTVGQHNPQQFIAPILFLLSQFKLVLPQVALFNLSFSGPLVLGFIYFQKYFKVLIQSSHGDVNTSLASFLGAMFFTMSPIVWAISISPFLYAVWLIPLVPAVLYYLTMYVRTGYLRHCLFGALICIIFSLAVFSIPWLLGVVLPICIGFVACVRLFTPSEIKVCLSRSCKFLAFISITQLFSWYPFIMSLLDRSGSFAGDAFSSKIQDSFTPAVTATMYKNNILFPVLNLFHRSIVFDFDWSLKSAFENVYDNTLIFNLVFVALVATAFMLRRLQEKCPKKTNRFYNIYAVAWLGALFLFTVNIGSFREIFIKLGAVPGFGMFRNAFDKFAIGYVFIYSNLFSFSVYAILTHYRLKKKRLLQLSVALSALMILVNAIPIKDVVNRKLWTTKGINTVLSIPDEYLDFMDQIHLKIGYGQSILSLPFEYPAYTIIREKDSSSVFAGSSPVKLFSGLDDFSGYMSFQPSVADRFTAAILSQNMPEVKRFLEEYNIGYIFVTNNIPAEVKRSYLFRGFNNQELFNRKIHDWFIPEFASQQIYRSENENYVLMKLKIGSAVLESSDLVFQKISPVKYRIVLKNIENGQKLLFRESFGLGWRLFSDDGNTTKADNELCASPRLIEGTRTAECSSNQSELSWSDMLYAFRKSLKFVHAVGEDGFSNTWKLATTDAAGTMAITLFFYPQVYFYIGVVISSLSLLILMILVILQERNLRNHEQS